MEQSSNFLLENIITPVRQAGFCFISGTAMKTWLQAQNPLALSDWQQFAVSWNNMPLDQYMADGGRYRRRRYATFSAAASSTEIKLEPHQPHYQSLDYNLLNGGIARDYEPMPEAVVQSASMRTILQFCLHIFGHMRPEAAWHIECHQFRIEASGAEQGNPTPEGVHRDGVDFVLVLMVQRVNISSGTTTMHDLEQRKLDSFTLTEPLDCAIVNDRRCMHGVTPVEQIDPAQPAYRDVLVITFKNANLENKL
jgi:hypothetical protein